MEQVDSHASAFNALIEAAKQREAEAVVIPTLYHLARFPGLQLAMKEHLERETGVRVLVMYPSPEGST